jgi:hypothetical protein
MTEVSSLTTTFTPYCDYSQFYCISDASSLEHILRPRGLRVHESPSDCNRFFYNLLAAADFVLEIPRDAIYCSWAPQTDVLYTPSAPRSQVLINLKFTSKARLIIADRFPS